MDVSDLESLKGKELIDQVIELTGLPDELARGEINLILGSTNPKTRVSGDVDSNLSLSDLRQSLLQYLESLHHAGLFENSSCDIESEGVNITPPTISNLI